MKANTRLFGEIDIEEEKIIAMEGRMIGFPELQKFALIFDEEKGTGGSYIMWLQSMEEPDIAFPVMEPGVVKEDYSPVVNDEILLPLGEMPQEDVYLLVIVTAAPDVKQTSVNLKAPVVINTDTGKGTQVIVENEYPIKFRIYDAVKGREKKTEE